MRSRLNVFNIFVKKSSLGRLDIAKQLEDMQVLVAGNLHPHSSHGGADGFFSAAAAFWV